LTITIAKGSGSSQIIVSQANVTTKPTAVVSGNAYTYDEYSISTTVYEMAATMVFNGKGSLSNKTLSESGTVVYTLGGVVYPGTWTTTLTKQ
jgi:hypothetical protein